MSIGGKCVTTLSSQQKFITFEEFITFLEAQEDKGPALCLSSRDYSKFMTALEKACYELGNRCNYEVINAVKKNIENVSRVR